jgi:hypothetical protein
MRSWQIRNILTTIALAVCCGVATAGPESASPDQPSSSSGVQSETKQSAKAVGSETKKSTTARVTKSGAKATASTKTKKAAAPARTKKAAATTKKATAAAPANTEKAAASAKTEKAAAPVKAKAEKTPPSLKSEKARNVPATVTSAGNMPTAVPSGSTPPPPGLHGIKDRARWAPKVCADTDKKLQGTVRAIDKEASKSGDRVVSARMFAEFRIPVETIQAERVRLSAPWGELVVAHTLRASAPGVTIDQLFDMRAEGLGWGQIAFGLGLSQKEVADAVRAEGRVVRGQSKPDGSPSPIASVEPGMDATLHAGTSPSEVDAEDMGTSVPEAVEK